MDKQTWKFAGEPESDCTLTPHFSESNRNASSARFCAVQTQALMCTGESTSVGFFRLECHIGSASPVTHFCMIQEACHQLNTHSRFTHKQRPQMCAGCTKCYMAARCCADMRATKNLLFSKHFLHVLLLPRCHR